MARIRSIKPEFFTSLTIADLPLTARLTFVGLWCYVDDNGVGIDEPRLIRAAVWPLDDRTAGDVETDLEALRSLGLVVRYEVSGKRYVAVRNWSEHQKVSHPRKPRFPTPEQAAEPSPTPPDQGKQDDAEDSGNPPENVQSTPEGLRPEQGAGSRDQGAGRERGTRRPDTPAPRTPRAAHLSLIPANWTPSDNDIRAARADLDRLGPLGVQAATAKFVRHHQAKQDTAADWGPLWVSWLARERQDVPTQGAFLVGIQGQGTKSQQQRAALAAAREKARAEGKIS